MKRLLGIWFHRNAHSPLRRVYFWCLRRLIGVFGKTQRVYFVNINGRRYKRVVFSDSLQAVQVQQGLDQFAHKGYFPELVERHENELLLGFIQGEAFDPGAPAHLEYLGDFFSDLYQHEPHDIAVEASFLPQRLQTDLRFLQHSGVIDSETQRRLAERAHGLQPQRLLLGWDYVDPVTKNFLIAAQKLAVIDVESLVPATPFGTGLAKAQLHWLDDAALNVLLQRIGEQGGPDLQPQLNYVALCFRVAWTKRKLLQGKRNFIERARLTEWAKGPSNPSG